MPSYDHSCNACNKEFELFYSIKADPPTICPLCNTEGKVVRLISGGSGRGIVELAGRELKEHVLAEANKMKNEARTNETLLANLVGENQYQSKTVERERVAKEYRPTIRFRK